MTERAVPPKADEVEVSIFGPGKGESICVHTGGGQWIIVDSCVDQRSHEIPVLSYLRSLGVDVSKDVSLVVGTHAHDDHIAGLSRVIEACSEAVFVCSAALTHEEYLRHVRDDAAFDARQSIRSEYRAIFEQIKKRPRAKRPYAVKYALAELPISASPESGDGPSSSVVALSPSHESVSRAIEKFTLSVVKPGDGRRPGRVDPNELAVVLFVVVGDIAVLLGADLERGPTGCGWQAILELGTFTAEPLASLFKIPHHGSLNAYHEDVWTQLLVQKPTSVLTPFRPSTLPRPEGIQRLKELSEAVYCSANPNPPNPSAAVKKTRAALRDLALDVRSWGVVGQVRARRMVGGAKWEVDLFHPALKL